ncbi:MAG: phage portal protein [Elusimicrobiota bacterium]
MDDTEFVEETNESELEDIQLVKVYTFGTEPEPKTKQLKDEFAGLIEQGDAIAPPIDLKTWALQLERNTRLNRAITTIARNTVGLGWDIVQKEELTKPESNASAEEKRIYEELKTNADEEEKRIEKLFERPNPRMPFTKVMFLVKVDEEATGNGYLEVSRNNAGIIDGLFHAPSHTIRVRKNGGFVQIRNGLTRYFKEFGDRRVIDNRTGEEFKPKSPDDLLPQEHRANELIHFMIYSPRSSHYGVPRHTATACAIAGNRLAAERNVVFFENDAVGRMAIIVSNGKLSKDSIETIKQFIEMKGKGVKNAHRVMLLQAEPKKPGITRPEDQVKIELKPLTVGVTEDASFLKYRQANDEEIRESFGLDTSFFSSGGTNRAAGIVGRQITIEQEFEPDIREKEYIINHTILADFGAKYVKFQFKRPKATDSLGDARIFAQLSRTGGITPNDTRRLLRTLGFDGFLPFKETWGSKPIQFSLQEMAQIEYGNEGEDEESIDGEEAITGLVTLNQLLKSAIEKYRDKSAHKKISCNEKNNLEVKIKNNNL